MSGYFLEADKKRAGQRYTAVYQASGKVTAEVVGGSPRTVDLGTLGKGLTEGGTSSGEDGFIYVLQSDEIEVVSESGAIIRKLPVKKPDSHYAATGINTSGGLVVVQLYKDEGKGKPLKAAVSGD